MAMETKKATLMVSDTGELIGFYPTQCFALSVLKSFLHIRSNRLRCLCSYGQQEQDEENLDDDEAAFDAPAVSGCAGSRSSTPHAFKLSINPPAFLLPGEEEAPLEHHDDESS